MKKREYTVWATRTSESGSPVRFFKREPGSWTKRGGRSVGIGTLYGIPPSVTGSGPGEVHFWHGEEILLGFRAGRKKRIKITIEEI